MFMSLVHKRTRGVQDAYRNFAHPQHHTSDAIFSILSSLDTPRSLSVWMLYSSNEHVQLLELDVNPEWYVKADEGKVVYDYDLFRRDYAATELLKKAQFLKTGFDLKERALSKFRLAEQQCKETNQRLRHDRRSSKPTAYDGLIHSVRWKISQILGDFSFSEFEKCASWGPGVTTLLKGDDVGPENKFQSETGVTRELYPLLKEAMHAFSHQWFDREPETDSSQFTIVEGNVVVTVPKNSKIDRVIAIEPGLNLFFQKAVGKMMKMRLRRWGVDLRHQSRNQKLAFKGSRFGHLATVDFSSASDTIAFELVKELLPPEWFTILCLLRSQVGKLSASESIKWEKFSSMGNGFTFELESLIFHTVALSCCEALGVDSVDVSTYGDDVIIPVSAYALYADTCNYFGFTVNKDKTFASGPFRESCGVHYFAGVDVKPIYLRKILDNAKCSYKLANSVRNLAHRFRFNDGCDRRLLPAWRHIVHRLPTALRSLKVPYGLGDGGLSSNFDEACPVVGYSEDRWEGFYCLSLVDVPITVESKFRGILAARLHALEARSNEPRNGDLVIGSDQSPGNSRTLRGQTTTIVKSLFVPIDWYDHGPWW